MACWKLLAVALCAVSFVRSVAGASLGGYEIPALSEEDRAIVSQAIVTAANIALTIKDLEPQRIKTNEITTMIRAQLENPRASTAELRQLEASVALLDTIEARHLAIITTNTEIFASAYNRALRYAPRHYVDGLMADAMMLVNAPDPRIAQAQRTAHADVSGFIVMPTSDMTALQAPRATARDYDMLSDLMFSAYNRVQKLLTSAPIASYEDYCRRFNVVRAEVTRRRRNCERNARQNMMVRNAATAAMGSRKSSGHMSQVQSFMDLFSGVYGAQSLSGHSMGGHHAKASTAQFVIAPSHEDLPVPRETIYEVLSARSRRFTEAQLRTMINDDRYYQDLLNNYLEIMDN